ncbi:hypothetical protein THAOC_13069, partial [Thalassiosira oceanica]
MTSIFVNFLVSIGGSSWETWATGGSGAAAQMDKSYKHILGIHLHKIGID